MEDRCFSITWWQPDTLQPALKHCHEDAFPNIEVPLVVAYTLPITTCETERVNGQLKLLKTYLHSTMTEEQFAALALIKVHWKMVRALDFDYLDAAFANKHPYWIAPPCLLTE